MGDNQNNNENILGSLSSLIPLKVRLIIGIVFFLFFIIIIFIIIILTAVGLSEEEENENNTVSSEVTVVEKDGLKFMSETSYFCYPITDMTGTASMFGASGRLWKAWHTGVDFLGPNGVSKVVAVAPGEVYAVSFTGPYGNHVTIKHKLKGKNGNETPVFYTMYCHLANVNVKTGDKVVQGSFLGLMGATGNVTGPHCHFEYSKKPSMWITAENPMIWLYEEKILKESNIDSVVDESIENYE